MGNKHELEWIDEAFRAFGHPLRRELLCLLDDLEDDIVELDQVSNHLASMQDTTTEQVTMVLLHVHLPKLQAVEFIEYDERSDTIRYRNHEFCEKVLRSGLLSVTA